MTAPGAAVYWARYSFDTFLFSLTAVVQTLTLENWNNLMMDCWRATSPTVVFVYFTAAILIGNYTVLNLFIAMLLSTFDGLQELTESAKRAHAESVLAHTQPVYRLRSGSALTDLHAVPSLPHAYTHTLAYSL